MCTSEAVAMVAAVSLEFSPWAAETTRLAGERDSRLGASAVARAARRAIAAWAMAVAGDDTMLTAMAQSDAAHWLLHPAMEHWQVAPGPRVTRIKISRLDADADADADADTGADQPKLQVDVEFTGRRRFDDPSRIDAADGDTLFIARLDLTLSGIGPEPWLLSSGRVWTQDQYRGYVFTSRRESPEEYRQRTGSAAGAAAAAAAPVAVAPAPAGTPRVFRLIAGFAEHDERFGSTALVEVRRETAPSRDEAEQLIWPAIDAETTRALGAGDWRPSLNWLDVIELLEAGGGFVPPPERTGN
jgi:hypothetical protein